MDTFQLFALARQAANRLPFQPDPFIYVFCWGGGGVFSQITWGIHLITQRLKAGRRLYLQRAEFSRAIIWWQIRGKKENWFSILLDLLWSPNYFDSILLSIKKFKLVSPIHVNLFSYKLYAGSSNNNQGDCRSWRAGYSNCHLLTGIGPSHGLLWQYHHQILQGNFQVASVSGRKKETKGNITKRKTAQGFLGARVCGISEEFFFLKSNF